MVRAKKLPRDWLEKIDKYQNEHLPFQFADESLGLPEEQDAWRQKVEALQRLLGGLIHAERPLGDWGKSIWQLLTNVYGHRALNTEVDLRPRHPRSLQPSARSAPRACRKFRKRSCLEYRPCRRSAGCSTKRATATIPASLTSDSVEMLGWLELPLDDAPALIVTSFNEGFVPQSLNSDLFMPNALAATLGIAR